MDQLDEILRSQEPERRQALIDELNREAALEELEILEGLDALNQGEINGFKIS